MTNREREFARFGFEYAEGIENAERIIIPTSGRYIRRVVNGDEFAWEVQPWNDTYWLRFTDLLEAVACGTKPT